MESAWHISSRVRCDLAAYLLSVLALGPHEFEIQLETQPEARRGSEVAAQTQIVFRRAAAAAFFHVRQMGRGNPRHPRDLRLRGRPIRPRFREAFPRKNSSAGSVRWFVSWSSMVVEVFHIGRLPVIPTENQASLLIDSHAPETLEIAGEGFESVAGWDSQILQNFGGVKLP